MATRPGFARLVPLMALAGLGAGAFALAAVSRQRANGAVTADRLTSAATARPGRFQCGQHPPASPARPRIYKCRTICRDRRVRDNLWVCGGRLSTLHVRKMAWALNRSDTDEAGAFLQDVDLRWADLTGIDLVTTRYDASTRWPAGFDPQAHGARLVR